MNQYAVLGIAIHKKKETVKKVNSILTEYGDYIIGRMGVRQVEDNLSLIALLVEGNTDIIGAMTGKLGSLDGVRVRSGLLKDK